MPTVILSALNPARIDYIFSRDGRLTAGYAEVVGAGSGNRPVPSGLWPSGHADRIAELQQD